MVVRQDRADIEEVSEPSNSEGQSQANAVGYATAKESNTGKSRIESHIGIVDVVCGDQTTGHQTIHSVEHARAEEADDGDEEELRGGRGIPVLLLADLDALVHPSCGAWDRRGWGCVSTFGGRPGET